MIASAGASPIRFCDTNELAMSAVALDDCTSAVTPRPARNAWKRFETLSARTLRSPPPNTRSTPERTICVPQTSSAMPARMLIRVCISLLLGGSLQFGQLGADRRELGLHFRVLRRKLGRSSRLSSSLRRLFVYFVRSFYFFFFLVFSLSILFFFSFFFPFISFYFCFF
jgi:hypothetical protein